MPHGSQEVTQLIHSDSKSTKQNLTNNSLRVRGIKFFYPEIHFIYSVLQSNSLW